ncbi:hypothetical protein FB107DRAFT_198344 [Schizophyllum commune]
MSALCGENGAFDFASGCVRSAWSALLPTLVVFLIGLDTLPLPPSVNRALGKVKAPFRVFLTVHEAEALSIAGVVQPLTVAPAAPLWRTVVLSFVSLLEALCWTAIASTTFILKDEGAWAGLQALLMAGTWLYAAGRPVVRPPTTVPWDLFVLFCAHLFGAVLILGGVIFDRAINGVPWPSPPTLVAQSLHLAAVLLVLRVVLQTQLNVPSDRIDKEEIRDIPEDYVTLFEWLTFTWVYAFIRKGRYNTLDLADVWNLSPIMRSRPVFIKFSSLEVPSLLQRVFWANSFDIIMDGVGHFFGVALGYARVYLLKAILDAVDHADASDDKQRSRAYLYALLSFLAVMLRCCIDMQHLWLSRRASTRIKSELMAAIYDKALKRKDFSGLVDADAARDTKGKADGDADTGKIVNLMSADASRISNLVNQLYFFYTAPFEIIVASIFLYQLLGWSAFAGFLVIPVLSPLNSMIGRRSVRIQKGVSVARDKRMGVLNEVVTAIKFIKFFAWESRWIERTLDARENEMKWMIKARLNTVLFYTLWSLTPILISATSFCVFVATGHQLTIATAFTAIALFTMLRWPLNNIPNVIMQILQCNVALKRIAVFLDEDEVTEQVSSLKKDLSAPQLLTSENGGALGIEDGTFRWNTVESKETDAKSTSDPSAPDTASTADTIVSRADSANGTNNSFELRDISVRFPEGKLTIVTGPTASGKTALLLAVLGEMTLVNGRLLLKKNPQRVDEHGMAHSISYAAQTPWLRHQSIKNNILFGYPYDEARYQDVVECCALKPDFDMLEDSDETEIGARGVNLSGGQKARVALARAVYARTKYVLLDDPLSAVDSHTSRFLFERLLCGPLLRNRTVVLVTHHVDLVLPSAHYFIRMLDGRIDTQGSVQALRAEGVLEDIAQSEEVEAHKVEGTSAQEEAGPNDDVVDIEEPAVAKKPRQLIKDEHREVGGVKWHIYKTYLGASSYWIWGILFFIVIAKEVLGVGERIWIIIWGRAYGHHANFHQFYSTSTSSGYDEDQVVFSSNAYPMHLPMNVSGDVTASEILWPDANEHPLFYVFIYAAIGVLTAIVNVSAISAQLWGGLRASRLLFRRLLLAVVHATFRFHDTTPQGRLLNRFGKDIETVDSSLASTLQSVNSSLATCFVAVLTIAVVFPPFLFPAIVIGLIFRECAIGYLETGRDLRRLEANTRSPIFSDFAEVLEGIVTVRAFSAEKRFMDNMHEMIDATSKCYYIYWLTNRWLQWCISTLGGLAVLITMIFSISSLNAGIAGLCITSALSFTDALYWACRNWTSLELDLNSVERVVEYLDLPQEPPAIIEDHRPPAYWPSSDSESLVSVENLSIRYSPELPAVIQNISFSLRGGERVGLLGRTGSGKSTLAMSLLRFVDPSSGKIVIDGIDITTIGVQDLRSRITFIPQDATLFSGTLKDNLPTGEHEDSEILDVLERVGMIGAAASRADSPTSDAQPTPAPSSSTSSITNVDAKVSIGPSTQVSPGGTNFSQGQRQLVAMARALLRQSSVIILDEATSSIDFTTDRKIQQTIREEFGRSLLITVAHRLRTVIDYDRLIVLDKGQIAEFDTPAKLIEKEDGIFRTMCLKSGHFAELEAAAKAKHI